MLTSNFSKEQQNSDKPEQYGQFHAEADIEYGTELLKSPFSHLTDEDYKQLRESGISDEVIKDCSFRSVGAELRELVIDAEIDAGAKFERQNGGHIAKWQLWKKNHLIEGGLVHDHTRGFNVKANNRGIKRSRTEAELKTKGGLTDPNKKNTEQAPQYRTEEGPKYFLPRGQQAGIVLPQFSFKTARRLIAKNNPELLDQFPEEKDARDWLMEHNPEAAEQIKGFEVKGSHVFWEFVPLHPEIPILITEGAKKALSLISHEYPAIALLGIMMHSEPQADYPDQTPPLKEEIVRLCQPGRRWYICLDNDKGKPKAEKNGIKARGAIAIKLKKLGCFPWVMEWDRSHGKGIDDVIAKEGEGFLNQTWEEAQRFCAWRIQVRRKLTLEMASSIEISERWLKRDYFPSLTKLLEHRLIGVSSPKNTGKTTVLAQLIEEAKRLGDPILMLSHREQLSRAGGKKIDIPYVDDTTAQSRAEKKWLGLCIDSLHEDSKVGIDTRQWAGAIVILDEWVQILHHLLLGNTCKKARMKILRAFVDILKNARLVIALDTDLDDTSMTYLKKVMGVEQPFIVKNTVKLQGYTSYVFETKGDWLTKLIAEIAEGGTPYISLGAKYVNSRMGTYNLEYFLQALFPDRIFLRIDADSITEPGHPAQGIAGYINEYLRANPKVILITSPTFETGISIDEPHFTAVFGYGNGVLKESNFRQAIARVRDTVPRYLWIAKDSKIRHGRTNACIPQQYWNEQSKLFNKMKKVLLSDFRPGFLSKEDELNYQRDSAAPFTPEIAMNTLAEYASLENQIAMDYRELVIDGLEKEGHTVIPGKLSELDIELAGMDPKKLSCQLTASKKEMYDKHKTKVTEAEGFETEEEFQQMFNRLQKTPEERDRVRHHQIEKRYGEVTDEIVDMDDRGLYPKLNLLFFATLGKEFREDRDKAIADPIIREGAFLLPDVNKSMITPKAERVEVILKALDHLGIDLDDTDRIYSNETPELIELKKLLTSDVARKEFRLCGLGYFNPNSTPIIIFRKLAALLGYKLGSTGKRQSQRKEKRYYFYKMKPVDAIAIKEKFFAHQLKQEQERAEARQEALTERLEKEDVSSFSELVEEVLVLGRDIETPFLWPTDDHKLSAPAPRIPVFQDNSPAQPEAEPTAEQLELTV
ncbi:MAG: DUF3854 domain-containing protein [Moorea sp. SIO4E2]|uniref:plasmid replication protein, CyRepA1 family n=1 Tax=Moorena sp. SIO4E2 TaxID=2607826 RepID=UPI0013B93115|nr:plasmid replication protein, CyRepA1 family [Moorena sp. SIO4E2]NEQ10238.1 DUF3854 domain-containing protein [Moorena sp. SIO4E2]